METDLFLALLEPKNPRGHPILGALLYLYCPAAARWWLAGADPVDPLSGVPAGDSPKPPFDPVWQALSDKSTGTTLKEALIEHGFEELIDEARQYVEQVEAWRSRHPGVRSPEQLPTFGGGRLPLSRRFGLQGDIQEFGCDWSNFFTYLRTWAFLIPDWDQALRFRITSELVQHQLALTAEGVRRPIYWPTWVWTSAQEEPSRQVVGILLNRKPRDELLLGLIRQAGLAGDKPWPTAPEVWLLNPRTGTAQEVAVQLGNEDLPQLIAQLAEVSKDGPWPPLRALQGSSMCQKCGFHNQCFQPTGELSPLAMAFT